MRSFTVAPDHAPLPWEIKAAHETIFSVFLLGLAFLFRNNPSITYPKILYVFTVFLGFNFLYNRFLKQRTHATVLAFSPIFVNGILITWAVHYTGGPASYLWVMYLLPVFTACLLYDGRGIWLSTAYVLALYASVYGKALWSLDGVEGLQFFGKMALLVLSASVTARLAAAERAAKAESEEKRRSFELSLEKLWDGAAAAQAENPKVSLFGLAVHDANAALSIILGSVQLLSRPAVGGGDRDDLARIESAVRMGKIILQNLFLLGEAGTEWPRKRSALHDLMRDALEQCRGEIRAKKLTIETSFGAPRDEALVNPRLVHQAITNFLYAGISASPAGGRIGFSSRLSSDGAAAPSFEMVIEDDGARVEADKGSFFDPRASGRGKGVGLGLYLGKEILAMHGADVRLSPLEKQGNRLSVRIPLAEGARLEGPPVRLAIR